MRRQLMISISREYGTDGHSVAEKIAEHLGLPLVNRNMLEEIAREKGLGEDHHKQWEEHDEKPKNPLLSRTVKGHSNSMEENLAQMQFEYMRKKADNGDSFVVLGRCSETVLAGRDGLVSIFITGHKEAKIAHVRERFGLSEKEAVFKMMRHDKSRRMYHNRHSDFKWGDSRNYDMCLNSSKLGVDGIVTMVEKYVELGYGLDDGGSSK